MSEYIRFVSYLYTYEQERKGRNVGFAKVEIRDGRRKVSLNVKGLYGLEEQPVTVYGLFRAEEGCVGTVLGELRLHSGCGSMAYCSEQEKLPNSRYSFQDMCGLLLTSAQNRHRCCGTIWDDLAFAPSDFLTEEECERRREAYAKQRAQEMKAADMPEVSGGAAADSDDGAISGEGADSLEADRLAIDACRAWKEELIKREHELQRQRALQQEADRRKGASASGGTGQGAAGSRTDAGNSIEDTHKWEIVLTPKEEIEYLSEKQSAEQKFEEEEAKREKEEAVLQPETQPEPVLETAIDTAEALPAHTREPSETAKEPMKNMRQGSGTVMSQRMRQQPSQGARRETQSPQQAMGNRREEDEAAWGRFCKVYQEVYPFTRGIGKRCLSIKPGDIGRLPREYWILGNNSFLLHGYYQFRHLILLREQDKNKVTYQVGVPGQNHSNEKFMAEMFGFERFVPAERKRREGTVFGYWCTPVRLTCEEQQGR